MAEKLLSQAAQSGHLEAGTLRACLIGSGTFQPYDPELARRLLQSIASRDSLATELLSLLAAAPPAHSATKLPINLLSADPQVFTVRGLLSGAECRYLRERAELALGPSCIIDPSTGKRTPHPVRTSYGTTLGLGQEALVVHQVNLRLAAVTRTGIMCGEPLHILRYSPGQEYRPHLDALPETAHPRTWTVLVYLNDA